MIIPKSNIISLASDGRMTLQVPEINFVISPNTMQTGDLPDSWFCYLKSDNRPCIGKQTGYLYLTREGYLANYDDLKLAFESSLAKGHHDRTNGVGWRAFENHAKAHFADVAQKISSLIAKKQNEVLTLKSFVI